MYLLFEGWTYLLETLFDALNCVLNNPDTYRGLRAGSSSFFKREAWVVRVGTAIISRYIQKPVSNKLALIITSVNMVLPTNVS